MEREFLTVGFSVNNLPLPELRNHFRPLGNTIAFYLGITSHDSKFKLIKRVNLNNDTGNEVTKLNEFLQESLSFFRIYCEEDP